VNVPKTYQVVTEKGLVIPQTLCASAQMGREVVVDVEPGRLAIRPARISAEEAQRRALRYVLTNLGDALEIGTPELQGRGEDAFWQVAVKRKAEDGVRGELRLRAEDGECLDWRPRDRSARQDGP